jgi:hypothetical protein
MLQYKYISIIGLTIVGLVYSSISMTPSVNSAMITCYQVKSQKGWTYIHNFKTRKIVGKLQNGMSFMSLSHMSDEVSDDKSIYIDIYGVGKGRLMVEKNQLQYLSTGDHKACSTRYIKIQNQEGSVNLRSAPNGSIIGQSDNLSTILFLERSADGEWTRVITIQGEIGWIHSSFLEDVSER